MNNEVHTVVLELSKWDTPIYRIQVEELGWRWETRATRVTKAAAYAEAERINAEVSENVRVVKIGR